MSAQSILSQRYAHAFLDLYVNKIDEKAFLNIVSFVNDFDSYKSFIQILYLYDFDDKTLNRLIDELLKKANLVNEFKKLIFLLLSKKRLELFYRILKFIVWEYQVYTKTLYFDILSAIILKNEDLALIQNFLANLSDGKIVYNYKIDETLIAGIKAVNSYYLFENSVLGILRKIQSLSRS